jgi:cysteine desulfurase
MLPEVLDAMRPVMLERYGNASSLHHKGREAKRILDDARVKIAALIGASSPEEIIFTSGGTESDNLAVFGTLKASRKKDVHLVTSPIEHHAILRICENMPKGECHVSYAPVDKDGIVDVAGLEKLIRDNTVLVSVMLANNEIGTIQPIREIAEICGARKVTCHTDAVQAVGKIPLNARDLGVDLLSFSAHKFHGPKGVGGLYVKKGTRIKKTTFGGHHERHLRAGTENVPGVVGMAKALEIAVGGMDGRAKKLASLRDRLESGVAARIPEVTFNGHREKRLPHIANVGFTYVEGEGIILSLDDEGVCVSSGSACTSEKLEPSHVLSAMGVEPVHAHGSIRFSLSEDITEADVDYTINTLEKVIKRLRQMSPLYKN